MAEIENKQPEGLQQTVEPATQRRKRIRLTIELPNGKKHAAEGHVLKDLFEGIEFWMVEENEIA